MKTKILGHLRMVVFIWGTLCQYADAQNLEWARSIGGAYFDLANSIAVDSRGNVYSTGYFEVSGDFDPGQDTFTLTATNSAGADIFLQKLNASGNLVWVKRIGGTSGEDYGYSVVLDTFDNVYVSGQQGPGHGFVEKMDSSGNFIWSKNFGGFSFSMAMDSHRSLYFTGYFADTKDFNPGSGTFNLTSVGFSDIYILKLDSSGNFLWAKQAGGHRTLNINVVGYEQGNSIVADGAGNVYLTGSYGTTSDFDPSAGIYNLTAVDTNDIFILKLDAAGNFVWAKSMGGKRQDAGLDITLDHAGNIYTTGYFSDTADFDPGAGTYNLISKGGRDIFIQKLDAAGNFLWAKSMGSAFYYETGNSVSIDSSGNVYSTGGFHGQQDFDPGQDTFIIGSLFASRYYIQKLDAQGNFLWAASVGGKSLTLDPKNNIYVNGSFTGSYDFDPSSCTFTLTSRGYSDVFVLKLGTDVVISGNILTETGIPIPGATLSLSGDDSLTSITNSTGKYCFTVIPNGTYTITPSKSNDSIPNNGITSLDVLLMRKHILGIAPLPSPYKIIAAAECNVVGDTTITTQDILFTRSLILGNINSFPTDRLWQFVSSDYVFPDSQHPFPFPTTRTYTNITTNQTNQNFIGIKLGDGNGSWDGNIP